MSLTLEKLLYINNVIHKNGIKIGLHVYFYPTLSYREILQIFNQPNTTAIISITIFHTCPI